MAEKQEIISIPYNFIPYYWQIPSYNMLQDGYKRGIWVDHRRCGKDIRGFNLIVNQMWLHPGLYYYVFPTFAQGRKILWEGYTDTGETFIQKYLPQGLLYGKPNSTDMKFHIYSKGNSGISMFQIIGTDNNKYEAMRGTNPIGVIFSEQARQHPGAWDVVRPILMKNGGWAIFQSTPNGDNHFKELYDNAKKNEKWFTCLHNIDQTYDHEGRRLITHADVEEEIRMGLAEDFAQQEFYCSFTQGIEGTYIGKQLQQAEMDGRIGKLPYDPTFLVDTYWDIGLGDADAIWFVQQVGKEIRIIDYAEATGATWVYWARKLQDKGYLYGRHYAPFDIENREKGGEEESAISRLERAKQVGISFLVTPRASFENGCEAIRGLLGLCSFDEEKCDIGIKHLKQWGKVWNKQEQRYTDFEKRDEHTHAGAAARYMAINIRQNQGYDVSKSREELRFKGTYRKISGGSAMSV
jgi:phage terminase large subunit